jgi:putative NADPH-quinone reductase
LHYLIIKSHPYEGSFNNGAANLLKETAQSRGHSAAEIDLIADGFDPVMSAEDLQAWRQGESHDPLVKKYQALIESADMLVFLFPVWWGVMPAVLKGFCDKVLIPGWAYKYDENDKMVGLLKNKKAIVVVTMEVPMAVFEDQLMNPIEGAFIKNTLQVCGIEVVQYKMIDKITSGREYAESKMAEIKRLIP